MAISIFPPIHNLLNCPLFLLIFASFFLETNKIHGQKTVLRSFPNQTKTNVYYVHFLHLLKNIAESIIQFLTP